MDSEISSPHVLMLPLPTQGDLKPMLQLAELICLADIKVTFTITIHNHTSLIKHSDIEACFSRYTGFQFKTIPDGLPDDHPRTGGRWLVELLRGLESTAEPFLREELSSRTRQHPVTCLIMDGMLSFAYDVAREAKVPVIDFRGFNASTYWVGFCIPKLIEAGEIPLKGDVDMDMLVQSVPGMTSLLRRRDLPSNFRDSDKFIPEIEALSKAFQNCAAHPLILNTFQELEDPILSLLQLHHRTIYCIGPLHAHLKHRLIKSEGTKSSNSTSSLWKEDRSCLAWLDVKPDKSVVYVSFGSLTTLTRDQLMEFCAGLVQSRKYFLWVLRSNMIAEGDPNSLISKELSKGIRARGCIVSWAPQEEVLSHRAVGGFLTHSGWNSTLESMAAGVPMLCWPGNADQPVNSRYVSQVWKIGLDMKDVCDRTVVAKMVNDLMDRKRDELEKSASTLSQLSRESISDGGSSACSLENLIADIKLVSENSTTANILTLGDTANNKFLVNGMSENEFKTAEITIQQEGQI